MSKKKDWTGYKYNTFEVIGEDIECNNLLKARVKAKEYALKNGYDYLALSYVDINNGSYKSIINKKLTEIEQRGESCGNKFNA